MNPRRLVLEAFQAALAAVNGRTLVREYLEGSSDQRFSHLVALGKAAAAMTAGACDAAPCETARGLIVTKTGHLANLRLPSHFTALESGHPVPDSNSLAAGERLLQFVGDADQDARFLVLISGGASALVEALEPPLTLDWLKQLNRWLLGSGLDIAAMNAIRGRYSRIKRGGLAARIAPRPALTLMISDVPGNDPAVIGGGTMSPVECDEEAVLAALPAQLKRSLPGTPPRGYEQYENQVLAVIGDNELALNAAAAASGVREVTAELHPGGLTGGLDSAARRIAARLLDGPPGLVIWGGETTMELPADPGRGGRNQSMALTLAGLIRGKPGVFVLAAGTDGTDGNTDSAGALVDGGSLQRGRDAGLDAGDCLSRANAYPFLAAAGDIVDTGPTGTNVMDLVLGLRTGSHEGAEL